MHYSYVHLTTLEAYPEISIGSETVQNTEAS